MLNRPQGHANNAAAAETHRTTAKLQPVRGERTGRSHGTRSGAALVTNATRAPQCRNNIRLQRAPWSRGQGGRKRAPQQGAGVAKYWYERGMKRDADARGLGARGWGRCSEFLEGIEAELSGEETVKECHEGRGQEPNGASSSKAVLLGALGGFETGQEQAPEGLLVSVHADRVASANVR
ncbi:hypothetical protein B0H14DRAFT_2596514 [Mycena olivaceomarginata]|nr:hypothetical protein B0H14DRAFT_2596514 [Mycena olivaceomarginata]